MSAGGSFSEVKEAVSAALVETTRAAGRVANEDLAFHKSSNPTIVPLLDEQNGRLLKLVRDLAGAVTGQAENPLTRVSDQESLDDNWRGFVDLFDGLLEKADACLDEFTGTIKRSSQTAEVQAQDRASRNEKARPTRPDRTLRIAKPQLLFERPPCNETIVPFKPLLESKPHAIKPLKEVLASNGEGESSQYPNPYESEIQQATYPATAFQKSDPIPYLSFEHTQAIWVDTLEGLSAMLAELKQAAEIAVDLEHHDEHSYIGLVSLMQISTRQKDWVIDTLKPWRHQLQMLNEVFADPGIMKIFHGSFMDMIWLQRDFGLYIVNLFDTYHASCVLGYERHSLAYLLKRFASFDAAKKYQMADWRIRPLTPEMFDYARSDTHFLLNVFDNMRNELVDHSDAAGSNLVEVVMMRSKEESLQRYERPIYDVEKGSGPLGWHGELLRTPALFSREQFAVFRAVHQWRDKVARQEDESVHMVISRQALYNLARQVPTDSPSLLGACQPMSGPVRKRKDELLEVIKQAKSDGATGPDMKDYLSHTNPPLKAKSENRHTASLRNPHQGFQSHVRNLIGQSVLTLRSKNSDFWGSIPLETSSHFPRIPGASDVATVGLILPLPQLANDTSHEQKDKMEESEHHDTSSLPVFEQYSGDRVPEEDETFILKRSGGSRKRKASDRLDQLPLPADVNTDSMNGISSKSLDAEDGPDLNIDQAQHQGGSPAASLKLSKRQKKAEKKRRRRGRETAGNEGANGKSSNALPRAPKNSEMNQPFDYANAPSVLHAQNGGGQQQQQQQQQQKHQKQQRHKGQQGGSGSGGGGVNPYAKALDAPKGMPRARKEMPGKSYTFQA